MSVNCFVCSGMVVCSYTDAIMVSSVQFAYNTFMLWEEKN
jgi:hypothetical protein